MRLRSDGNVVNCWKIWSEWCGTAKRDEFTDVKWTFEPRGWNLKFERRFFLVLEELKGKQKRYRSVARLEQRLGRRQW